MFATCRNQAARPVELIRSSKKASSPAWRCTRSVAAADGVWRSFGKCTRHKHLGATVLCQSFELIEQFQCTHVFTLATCGPHHIPGTFIKPLVLRVGRRPAVLSADKYRRMLNCFGCCASIWSPRTAIPAIRQSPVAFTAPHSRPRKPASRHRDGVQLFVAGYRRRDQEWSRDGPRADVAGARTHAGALGYFGATISLSSLSATAPATGR
jgi:hypothetical protein